MVQKSPAQLGIFTDPPQPGVGGSSCFVQGGGAEVGQFSTFQVPPEELDGVEVSA